MSANTEKPLFTIRLTGEGLHPHLIPASDLAQLLMAAEQTVLAVAVREHPDESERGQARAAFEELRHAAGGAYDEVADIDLFARRVREGDLP